MAKPPETHYTRIYRIWRRWVDTDCMDAIFAGSVSRLHEDGRLDTAVIYGDATPCFDLMGHGEAVDLKAHLKVDLKAISNSTIEIISARERRRRWSVEEKLRIVAETHEPGASVRAVAARDVYPNLLRTWQRLVRQGRLSAAPPACFVPVRVLEPAPAPAVILPAAVDRPAADTIEISLPDGSRVRVGNDVNLAALRRVMTVLRG